MTGRATFSPVAAALEGLRTMRREPMAVLYWIAVWALAITAIGAIKSLAGASPAPRGASRTALDLIRSYGPLAPVLVPVLLGLGWMNIATVYRAVLTPGEHGWHLFKLAADEGRIAVVSLVGTALLTVFGGFPAYLLLVLFDPLFQVAPGLSRVTAVAGFFVTVALEVWIAVRFSLAPVETFAEKGFPVGRYWRITRGYFWPLFGAYLIVFIELLVFLALFAIVGVGFGFLAAGALAWRGPDLLRRLLILSMVPITAVLSAVLWVAPLTLIAACQSYAYRAIANRPATAA